MMIEDQDKSEDEIVIQDKKDNGEILIESS